MEKKWDHFDFGFPIKALSEVLTFAYSTSYTQSGTLYLEII